MGPGGLQQDAPHSRPAQMPPTAACAADRVPAACLAMLLMAVLRMTRKFTLPDDFETRRNQKSKESKGGRGGGE